MRAIIAVLWAFLGIRKGDEYDKDVAQVTPVQAIAAGIVMALVFVVGLVVLVRFIVAR